MGMDDTLLGEFIDAAVQNPEKARSLLAAHPDLRERRRRLGETALHFLAIEGFLEGVRFCCENGFDVDATNKFGDTPLVDVATLGALEMASLLLDHGADPNAKTDARVNVLYCAVGSGNVELVRRLLAAGARPDPAEPLPVALFLPADEAARTEVTTALSEFGINVSFDA
ncbi:MAG: ankyrin repeat domain-containing protein [Phycisphaerales bacterium]|nr:ankyrin repeat domain-containing protein [Phycisphaerales bacterium]